MKRSFIRIFILSFILGIIIFIISFGIHIINPTNVDWIYQLSCNWQTCDTPQHYFGWVYYRNSQWNFPIGLISQMTIADNSVIFTDAIPIVAVFFKILSPILPETFQYFGLCSVIAFGLNGAFSGILLRKGIRNDWLCIALSSLFILAPSLSEMTFLATSLTGQWTCLAAICLWFYSPYINKWQNTLLWSLLAFVSMGIHLYIAAMVLAIFVFSVISDMIVQKHFLFNIIKVVIVVITCLIYLWIFGFFSGSYVTDEFVNGNQEDLLIFFKPSDAEEYIGTALFGATKMTICGYLGIGIIIGALLWLVMLVVNKRRGYKSERELCKTQYILCVVLMVCCFCFAITPNIFFNGQHIITLEFPDIINKLYGAFRINSRFIWVVNYLIMYFVIVGIYKSFKKKYVSVIVLTILSLLQVIDCYGAVRGAYNRINNGIEYVNTVNSEVEQLIKEHDIVYMRDIFSARQEYWDIVDACIRNNKIVSSYYLARVNSDVQDKEDLLYEDLQNGIIHEDVLYVFETEEYNKHNYDMDTVWLSDSVLVGCVRTEKPILSMLGDSVSSYYPYGQITYYGPEGSGSWCIMPITSMWWYRYADENGLRLGTMNGVGMSRVAMDENDPLSFNSKARIESLDDNGTPNVIAIFGGMSDLAVEAFDVNYFASRYEVLVDKLHSTYPGVKLIIMAPYHLQNGAEIGHDNSILDGYDEAMRQIAEKYNDYYVDLRTITFTADDFDEPNSIHANEQGQKKIADMVKKSVKTSNLKQ